MLRLNHGRLNNPLTPTLHVQGVYKVKYAPDYPRVTIRAAYPGRFTSIEELDRLGIVAPPDAFKAASPARPLSHCTDKWPSYAMCLDKAPPNSSGTGPDRSRADYWFCFLAQQWGHGESDTADRLMQESPKAREKGKSYAAQTARQAAAAVERRRQQQPPALERFDAVLAYGWSILRLLEYVPHENLEIRIHSPDHRSAYRAGRGHTLSAASNSATSKLVRTI